MIDFLWLKNNNIITWILDIQIFRRLLYDGKSSLQVIDLSTQGGWLSAVSSIKPRADEHNIIRSIFLLCSAAHLVVENQMMVTCISLDKYQSKKFERLDPEVQNPSRFDLKELDPKAGIKWKLTICEFNTCQNCFENFTISTSKTMSKKCYNKVTRYVWSMILYASVYMWVILTWLTRRYKTCIA